MWTWGRNNVGQLGLNNTSYYSASPNQIGALTTWLNIANAYFFALATKTDGTLWTWGRNIYGNLGQGDTVTRSAPVQVGALTTWTTIGSGVHFPLAIKG